MEKETYSVEIAEEKQYHMEYVWDVEVFWKERSALIVDSKVKSK